MLFNSFDTNWNLYTLHSETLQVEALTTGDAALEKPVWSTEGNCVAYTVLRSGTIVVRELSGESTTLIEDEAGGGYRFGCFGPDGQCVYLTRPMQGVLLQHDLATGQSRTLLTLEGFVATPSCSPDGRWIAFQYNETSWRKKRGRWDVYVVASGGGDPVCLTSEFPGHSVAPLWRPAVANAATRCLEGTSATSR